MASGQFGEVTKGVFVVNVRIILFPNVCVTTTRFPCFLLIFYEEE